MVGWIAVLVSLPSVEVGGNCCATVCPSGLVTTSAGSVGVWFNLGFFAGFHSVSSVVGCCWSGVNFLFTLVVLADFACDFDLSCLGKLVLLLLWGLYAELIIMRSDKRIAWSVFIAFAFMCPSPKNINEVNPPKSNPLFESPPEIFPNSVSLSVRLTCFS